MSVKLAGLASQKGDMKKGSYTLFPVGDYLLTAESFTTEIVKDDEKAIKKGKAIAVNVSVVSVVGECENLPANEDGDSYIGKKFTDRIYVMTPNHVKYANDTAGDGTVGDIGLNALKSFLNAVGVKVSKENAFNEKAIPGKDFEVTMGTNTYDSKRSGKKQTGNQVNEYRVAEEAVEEEEEVDEVEGEEVDDDSDLDGLDDDLGLGDDLDE